MTWASRRVYWKDDRGRSIDVHALRTTYGTRMAEAGVPLATLQRLMNHSSPNVTAQFYAKPRMSKLFDRVEGSGVLSILAPSIRPSAS